MQYSASSDGFSVNASVYRRSSLSTRQLP
jgi:hypothetical protein